MPELPEVETVARQLAPLVEGRVLRRVRILDARLRDRRAPPHSGREITRVFRCGKQVLFALGGPRPLYLAVHLRMTGRLVFAERAGPRDRHTRARLELDRGAIVFVDTRRFGTLRWARAPEEILNGAIDPMSSRFTPENLARLLGGSRQPIKPWLLRQDRLIGLGNIYASEILHAARIDPVRPAGSLDRGEVRRLHRATGRILSRAIQNCGTTFSDFQDARGLTGRYQRYLAVYGREGEPCRTCGSPIERIVQQQRSTFRCPRCLADRRSARAGTSAPKKERAGREGPASKTVAEDGLLLART